MELSARRERPSAEFFPFSPLPERHFVDYIPPTEKETKIQHDNVFLFADQRDTVKGVREEEKRDSTVQIAMLDYV
ncbi:hypothetical protein TNCV_783421 [Trichonephila clavipes]|nr:hypothetical protein TNCV_783421 [Trichonephila clavipes]